MHINDMALAASYIESVSHLSLACCVNSCQIIPNLTFFIISVDRFISIQHVLNLKIELNNLTKKNVLNLTQIYFFYLFQTVHPIYYVC